MTTASPAIHLSRPHPWWPRLVDAELLKLRRRRGLVFGSLALTVAPMVVAYALLVVRHATDPDTFGPAGAIGNFSNAMSILASLASVAAALVGVTIGAGDLGAGVFRELVVTGRSRLQLFAARVPAGLAFLLPVVSLAFAVPAVASLALAGADEAAAGGLLLHSAGLLALETVLAFVLALGVASVVGSRGTSIAIVLGWQLAVAPALAAIESVAWVRGWLSSIAVDRLAPDELGGTAAPSLATVAAIALWTLLPLAAGAWRTSTRDA